MPDDATLFVIFHGSWSFLDTPNYVYVKTPELGDEHVYRSGNWLAEHDLPHGSYYRLTDNIGTDLSSGANPQLHPVIKDASIAGTRDLRGSHTTLLLAKPQKWYHLVQFSVPPKGFVINSGAVLCQKPNCNPGEVHDPTTDPTICSFFHVFEYSYNTCCPPYIAGMTWWQPIAIPDFEGRGKAATLHFFAEHEDRLPDTVHFDHAFRFGSFLLGGDLDIVQPNPTQPLKPLLTVNPTQEHFPSLLDHRLFEFLPLSFRETLQKQLGVGLATLNSQAHPTNDDLQSYFPLMFPLTLTDVPDATCLPNAGQGGCP
jgi:hypothetical protein